MTQVPPRDAIILRWFFLIALISALGLACVGSVIAIANDGFANDQTIQLIVYTPLIILLCGAIGLSGTLILQSGRLVNYMRAMIILLMVSSVIGLVFLWSPELQRSSNADLYYALCGNLVLIMFSMLLIAQLLILKARNILFRYCGMLIAISQCAAVLIVLIHTWTDILDSSSFIANWLLGIWITLNLFGMLLLPPIARMIEEPKLKTSESFESRTILNLTCPKCGNQQCLPTGLVRCTECKFTMIIELEEPRCECGYLLYKLQGDVCPECGNQVAESDHWAVDSAQEACE